jgi:signal transduction histidine kinase/cytochrome c peroxidase
MRPTASLPALLFAFCALLVSGSLAAQGGPPPNPLAPLGPAPVPAANPQTPAKIALGQALFWDEQLSVTGTVACGTCHAPRGGGSDARLPAASADSRHPGGDGVFGTADDSIGALGVPRHDAVGAYLGDPVFGMAPQAGARQSISAVNAAYPPLLFWDGRARADFIDPATGQTLIATGGALENQALGPLVNDVEMAHAGGTLADMQARIGTITPLRLAASVPAALAEWIDGRDYPALFAEVFGSGGITAARIAMAMASYQRSLVANQTPHDLELAGTPSLTQLERQGRQTFNQAGCNRCHGGALLSDNAFHYLGVRPPTADEGRMAVTGLGGDRGRMRTPGLRGVELSAPYMADGRFATLEEVIDFYDRGGDFSAPNKAPQITPLGLTAAQKTALAAFLRRPLTDPRLVAEAGPFERPQLYGESDAVPQPTGAAIAGGGGRLPRLVAIEPPLAGSDTFTVAVDERCRRRPRARAGGPAAARQRRGTGADQRRLRPVAAGPGFGRPGASRRSTARRAGSLRPRLHRRPCGRGRLVGDGGGALPPAGGQQRHLRRRLRRLSARAPGPTATLSRVPRMARMQPRLWHRWFLLSAGLVLLALAALLFAQERSFQRGLLAHANALEQSRLGPIVERLAAEHQEAGGWWRLLRHPPRWQAIVHGDALAPPADRPRPPGPPGLRPPPGEPRGMGRRLSLLDPSQRPLRGEPPSPGSTLLPIEVAGRVVGYLTLAPLPMLSESIDLEFAATQRRQALVVALLVLAASLLASWLLSRSLLRRLDGLADATRRLAAGDLGVRLGAGSGGDELAALARDFDRMAEALQRGRAARDRWIADISHELRTPLTVLRGELQALQDGVRPLTPAALESLDAEAARLAKRIEDLYALALSDSGGLAYRFAPLDLTALLAGLVDSRRESFARAGLALASELAPRARLERGDAARLEQLFGNLLDNALRYTAAGGRVALRLIDGGDAHWRIDIDDSAPGVAPDELARLGERHFRAASGLALSSAGSGLGLAIARNIAQAHGGTLAFAASALGGLQARVRLPHGGDAG